MHKQGHTLSTKSPLPNDRRKSYTLNWTPYVEHTNDKQKEAKKKKRCLNRYATDARRSDRLVVMDADATDD